MAQNARIKKKWAQHWKDFDAIMEWHQDFRAYLLEAVHENIDLRIIVAQFKRKLVRGQSKNRYFKRTRMDEYVKISLD